ncbi:3-deoxy-D-manno-octulosonic acid kinase [Aliidiomarina sedimenti]|uniref:3-deoxy-D-manno-octulosonic acid kinase n=1 Tax=Aliidiomarina sedimenti TaxID=1933879 RepID=A0ABY0C315_9GAMM|nr:3-deoxy-D-manno-octulosonic acid kinase [Aliidiomarina sedimenti]RUO31840.1 3-deoxy-D-manno-octulosonic acid kinase [Aliidiomarina sedimenti]
MSIVENKALLKAPAKTAHFEMTYWQQQGMLSGSAGGRNLAYFIAADNELSDLPMVLRHYYRGGMVGKVNRDWFLRTGAKRSVAEFELLDWMHGQGLPVPRPIAALVQSKGLFYRADILIERLPCNSDLFAYLSQKPLSEAGWAQVGRAIGALHRQQVFHSDLNCHNILLADPAENDTEVRVWLIDFDKCHRVTESKQQNTTYNEQWKSQNLQRLLRSLHKEQQRIEHFAFTETDWQALMSGYQQAGETAQ